jgi:hypothetical protein
MPHRLAPARLARLGALAALAALAGCSSDGPQAPSAIAPLDVAPLLAEATPPSLPAMPELVMAAPYDAAGVGARVGVRAGAVPTSCPYDAASRSFVCAPVTRDGLTVTFAYTLLDAAGQPLAQPDRNVVASLRTVATVAGTITPPAGAAGGPLAGAGTLTVAHRQEMALSGLLAGPHRLDGTGSTKVEGRVRVGALTIPTTTTLAEAVEGLVLPEGGTGATGAVRWPIAGTLTIDATTAVGPAPALAARVQMAFEGAGKATITTTIGGVTRRCTVDLARVTGVAALGALVCLN